jgi:GNAT superfamily N-acetyltransferase
VQLACYVRVQWPFVMGRGTPLWGTDAYPPHGVHFVVLDGNVLVSHALTHDRTAEHRGDRYAVGALSSVFTYPAYRGLGHAGRVVAAATHHIRAGEADVAMLFAGEPRHAFYARAGWELIAGAEILAGDRDAPHREKSPVMMLFLSDRGRQARAAFEREPVYAGPRTW